MEKGEAIWSISKDVVMPAAPVRERHLSLTLPAPVTSTGSQSVHSGVLLGLHAQMLGDDPQPCSPLLETVPEYSTIRNIMTPQLITDSPATAATSPSSSSPESVSRPKRKMGTLSNFILPNKQSPENNFVNEEDEVDTLASPPGHRKNILDSLRPRSKSDAYASYKQKKSSFLNQLKIKKASRNGNISDRPMSPLVDTTSDIRNNNIKQGPTDVTSDKIDAANDKDDINEECPDPSPKKSPDTGEFRARAASAGQQARAHVSQIVARFRNRSNTNTDERDRKRYKIVGHKNLHLLNQDSSQMRKY